MLSVKPEVLSKKGGEAHISPKKGIGNELFGNRQGVFCAVDSFECLEKWGAFNNQLSYRRRGKWIVRENMQNLSFW